MKIKDYIKLNKIWIIRDTIIFVIINCILYSSSTINEGFLDIMYMDILILIIILIDFTYRFIKEKEKYTDICNCSESINKKDKEQYKTLKQIGMSKEEVRKTVNV